MLRPRRTPLLGAIAEGGIVVAVTILFTVSGGLLWLVGYNYDGLTGGAAAKIHPSTYLIILIFGWAIFASGDPVGRSVDLANRRPATLLMLVVALALFALTAARGATGLAGVVDTFVAPALLVFLLTGADERLFKRLELLLHVVMTANALLGLAEFATKILVFPYRFDGVVFETDTRSSALHGHPLANAMVTACYVMALLAGGRLAPMVRVGLVGLQLAALVAFGGRTALVLALVLGAGYATVSGFARLRQGSVSLPAAALVFMLAGAVPAVIAALISGGFFDALIERFVADGGSANARIEMFELVNAFTLSELIVGPDMDRVETLRRIHGLALGIENPFVRMMLYQGAFVTLIVSVAFILFMFEISRGATRGLWLPMLMWVVLLNGAETIGSKTTMTTKFVIIVLCLFRASAPEPPLSQVPLRRIASGPDSALRGSRG